MLQELLTVFTFWHDHWMQGLVFFNLSHKIHNAIKMNTVLHVSVGDFFVDFVLVFHYNLSYLLYQDSHEVRA